MKRILSSAGQDQKTYLFSSFHSIIFFRSLTFISASPFGNAIPSSSILAMRHVREQNILSGLVLRSTVLRHA